MATNIAIRLQSTGGAELKRDLEEAGRTGQQAFQGFGTAADMAGAATDRLTKKAQEAADAARRAQGAAGTPAAPAPAPTSSPTTSREIERLRSQLDEEYRRAKQLGAAEGRIGRGVSGGYFDAAEGERLRSLAAAKYGSGNDNDPSRRGLSTYDKQFIRYQGFDVASSLGSGASPITTAFQQGPQVLQQLADRDGGLGAGLKQLGQSALSLVTPFTVGATAVTAMGAALAFAAVQAGKDREVLEKSTRGIGAATGATVSQLDSLAKASAESGKVSASTAREYVASYASLGTLAVPVIGDLTRLTSDYARITGQDGATAATELGRAVSEGGTALEAVAGKIGGLDDKTRQLIQTQIEQGDRAGAQATAAEYLKSTIEANTAATTGWAGAWNAATAAANGYWEAAKRIAGIKLGIAPEGAAEAAARLQTSVDNTNRTRQGLGLDPLNGKDSEQVRQLATSRVIADQERMIAEGKAAEERATRLSREAGDVARGIDPNLAQLAEVDKKLGTLRDGLSDPLTRSKLDPATLEASERGYDALFRARSTLVDVNNKLISSEERARQQDQLTLDAKTAKTDAEKAAVAVRQKEFDLAGKVVTNRSAADQIAAAGVLSRADGDAKGSGGSEAKDDYDRATRSLEDRIRRQHEEAQTYGMGAEAVARYRTEQELLTAAKRADRDVTPQLTAQIQDYVNRSGEAAKRMEELRDSSRRMDDFRSVGGGGVQTLVRGLADGASAGRTLENVLSSIKNRVADLAANSISDMLFGKRGTSDYGLLSSFLGGGNTVNAPASGAQGPTAQAGGLSSLLASAKSFFGFAEGRVPGVSADGIVSGPGTSTSDSIPAWISDREAIIKASSVDHYGAAFIKSINDRTFRFADGMTPYPTGEFGGDGGYGEVLA